RERDDDGGVVRLGAVGEVLELRVRLQQPLLELVAELRTRERRTDAVERPLVEVTRVVGRVAVDEVQLHSAGLLGAAVAAVAVRAAAAGKDQRSGCRDDSCSHERVGAIHGASAFVGLSYPRGLPRDTHNLCARVCETSLTTRLVANS